MKQGHLDGWDPQMKCEASRDCGGAAEMNLSWLFHPNGLDAAEKRTGGNFCGACSTRIWEKVSQSPSCVSSAVIRKPQKLDDDPWKSSWA